MTARRGFLASSVAVIAAIAGCAEQSGPATTEATPSGATPVEPPETIASSVVAATAPAVEDVNATTGATTVSTTDAPVVNRSAFPVAWEWDLTSSAVGDDLDPRRRLLTTDDWRDVVDEDVLSPESRSFLSETDFDAGSVVAHQTSVADGLNRLILHSVEGVGTETVTLTVEEWVSEDGGVNVEVSLLLLVRVPNRGTEPTGVEVASPQTTTEG